MKKFIVRGICFVAIGLALLTLVNHFYVRTNGYRSLDETYKFYLMPENIEVANFGSSHATYGFYYDDLEGITGFNFALPGQGLYYDLKLLEKYADRLAEGCVVIIPLSYFSFDLEIGLDNPNRLYYRLLGYWAIPHHKLTEYIKRGLLPILSASFNARYLIVDKEEIYLDIFWIFAFSERLGLDDERAWEENAQWFWEYVDGVTRQGENMETNISCLERMIEYCKDRGLKPFLVTTPVTKYYRELFKGERLDSFHAQVRRVQDEYDVPYLDYSSDPRISKQLRLFKDSNHLNDRGRRAFTKVILSDLGLI